MRVLILSVTAGFGHHATAKAIGDMLESKGACENLQAVLEPVEHGIYILQGGKE